MLPSVRRADQVRVTVAVAMPPGVVAVIRPDAAAAIHPDVAVVIRPVGVHPAPAGLGDRRSRTLRAGHAPVDRMDHRVLRGVLRGLVRGVAPHAGAHVAVVPNQVGRQTRGGRTGKAAVKASLAVPDVALVPLGMVLRLGKGLPQAEGRPGNHRRDPATAVAHLVPRLPTGVTRLMLVAGNRLRAGVRVARRGRITGTPARSRVGETGTGSPGRLMAPAVSQEGLAAHIPASAVRIPGAVARSGKAMDIKTGPERSEVGC